MSFLYPRTIQIARPVTQQSLGQNGYNGLIPSDEHVIAENIPASIQLKSSGGKPSAGLPADAKSTQWLIFIPLSALPNGTVKTRDIVTDDLGLRYQIASPWWDSLGYVLSAEILEL